MTDFDSPLTTVIQGGASNVAGTGTSGQPNTPYGNENVQALALTGTDQLALANSGGTNSNGTQFFITTGPADALGYNYTVFGQLVAGQNTLNQMATQVSVQKNSVTGENSQPVDPLTITSASLSSTSPDGVVILNTTAAKPGETATVTVTATDPADGTTATESFNVVVGTYVGPTTSTQIGNINFAPYTSPVSVSTYENLSASGQLSATNTYPDATAKVPLTYSLAVGPEPRDRQQFQRVDGHVHLHARSRLRRLRQFYLSRDGVWSGFVGEPRREPGHHREHQRRPDPGGGPRRERRARHEQEGPRDTA